MDLIHKETRFERHFNSTLYTDGNIIYKTLHDEYSNQLKDFTKPDEIDYLLSNFIAKVKSAFNLEKSNQ